MASHNISSVREQLRGEIIHALTLAGKPLTASELFQACKGTDDPAEIARVCYELKKKNLVADAGKVIHPLGMPVNSYSLPPPDPYLEAAKPIIEERKIPRTVKVTKPAATHPFNAPIGPRAPQDRRERVTRDLPLHLRSTAHQMAADSLRSHIEDQMMSEDPTPYHVTSEPQESLDSDLVEALLELAPREPEAMASADVGEIAAAMDRRHQGKITAGLSQSQDLGPEIFLPNAEPKKSCQCQRATLPTLPPGYLYGGLRVWIDNEHDPGRLTLTTVDEGAGAFLTLKARGRLAFDTGELVMLGQVGDELIRLHDRMDKQNND